MAVVIETTLGDITVDLFTNERPRACLNFLKLCKLKYYNYNLFHTVQHGFVAQSGDPTGSGTEGQSIWGVLEGPTKRYFEGESMPKIKHTDAGQLSMVATGENMLGSQFFLTLDSDLTSLDGTHCVIGEVTEGHDVLRKFNEAICDSNHRPYQDIRITHTVVLEDPYDDPKGFREPTRSPSPSAERLQGGRIAPDEAIDETEGKSLEEINEMIQEREAKARATILEIVGDLPDADMAPPENVLFVCKLNPVTNDEDLEIIFARFGKIVSCEVIRDKISGDSLQYAFVEFDNRKSCEDAYIKMDNVLIDDRRIHVDFSQSVSKVKWRGKGRGVVYANGEDAASFNNNYKKKQQQGISAVNDKIKVERRSDSRETSQRERRDSRDTNRNKNRSRSREINERNRSSRERSLKNRDSRERSPKDRDSRERSPKNRNSRERSPRNRGSRERSARNRSSRDRSPRDRSFRNRSPRNREYGRRPSPRYESRNRYYRYNRGGRNQFNRNRNNRQFVRDRSRSPRRNRFRSPGRNRDRRISPRGNRQRDSSMSPPRRADRNRGRDTYQNKGRDASKTPERNENRRQELSSTPEINNKANNAKRRSITPSNTNDRKRSVSSEKDRYINSRENNSNGSRNRVRSPERYVEHRRERSLSANVSPQKNAARNRKSSSTPPRRAPKSPMRDLVRDETNNKRSKVVATSSDSDEQVEHKKKKSKKHVKSKKKKSKTCDSSDEEVKPKKAKKKSKSKRKVRSSSSSSSSSSSDSSSSESDHKKKNKQKKRR